MDLLTVKQKLSASWADLEQRSGVSRSNLFKIAHGERGWDVLTGWKLKKLGVSLDEQVEVMAKRQGWHKLRATRLAS